MKAHFLSFWDDLGPFMQGFTSSCIAVAILLMLIHFFQPQPVKVVHTKEVVSKVQIVRVPYDPVKLDITEVTWLARNIYFEARNQDELGQRAVAYVTMNRVKSPDWPNTVKDVVSQRNKSGCQFSWVCEKGHTTVNPKVYTKIVALAEEVLRGTAKNPIGDATYYHTREIQVYWDKHMEKTAILGDHVFFEPKTR